MRSLIGVSPATTRLGAASLGLAGLCGLVLVARSMPQILEWLDRFLESHSDLGGDLESLGREIQDLGRFLKK